jgi:hypothetical protein
MSDPPSKPRNPGAPIESVGAAKAPKRAESAESVEDAAATEAAAPAESVAEVASQADVALAEALSTGAVDPAGARASLIDEVVRAQLPDDAAPELIEKIRGEVEALLGDDPTLAALLDPRR